ncbi:hypothetical protein [Shinella zoogloeoides]|nr:hypothetical protein [Shinella zoogloeoides]
MPVAPGGSGAWRKRVAQGQFLLPAKEIFMKLLAESGPIPLSQFENP